MPIIHGLITTFCDSAGLIHSRSSGSRNLFGHRKETTHRRQWAEEEFAVYSHACLVPSIGGRGLDVSICEKRFKNS